MAGWRRSWISVAVALGVGGLVAAALGGRPCAEAAAPAAASARAPSEPRARPACTASVDTLLAVERDRAPALDDQSYDTPSADERAAFDAALRSAGANTHAEALRHAADAGYAMCWADDVLVATPLDPSGGHARIAVRGGPARPLVVEAPHPFHDLDTRSEATALFEDLSLRAVVISGTYRCANPRKAVDLPGRTHACGSLARYPASDMAHNPNTLFQQAHETLLDLYPEAMALSVHGMAAAGASVSDGTRLPTQRHGPAAGLGRALQRAFPSHPITACNPGAGVPVRYRLCGTTNAQGRATNGSASASYREPAKSSSRFVHLEQSLALRRQPDRVAHAVMSWLDGRPR